MNRVERHRKKKRLMEVMEITRVLEEKGLINPQLPLKILEFGTGVGDQIPELKKYGNVSAIDIYTHSRLNTEDVNFIECSITSTPFENNSFDWIYSNHVIAHIGESRAHDLSEAFSEMLRIGKEDCYYTFAVPTRLWLLLSLPAHYFDLLYRLFKKVMPSTKASNESEARDTAKPPQKDKNYLKLLLPGGLGIFRTFFSAYKGFGRMQWIKLFDKHGMKCMADNALATYSASELPIVPTTRILNRWNIGSSRLYILKKK